MHTGEHAISRRNLLAKGAAAGAVLWAAPVIESVTSRAAAASTTCTSTATFNASYVFVVFTDMGTTYFSGTSGGSCGNQNSAQGGPKCASCGNVAYTLNDFSGAGNAQGALTYGSTCTGPQTAATYVGSATCSQYLTVNGGTVSAAQPGVQIVAAFCFGAGTLTAVCASTESSQGCAYANCG